MTKTYRTIEEAVQKLPQHGPGAHSVPLDVTGGAAVAAARPITEQFGKLDVLVNDAEVQLDDVLPSVFGVVWVTQAIAARTVDVGSAMGESASGSWHLACAASRGRSVS